MARRAEDGRGGGGGRFGDRERGGRERGGRDRDRGPRLEPARASEPEPEENDVTPKARFRPRR
jgi:ribonuclease G